MNKKLVKFLCGCIPSRKIRRRLRNKLTIEQSIILPPYEEIAPPPNTIPEQLVNRYTMNGKIPVFYQYYDDHVSRPLVISEKDYLDAMQRMEDNCFVYYGNSFSFFRQAIDCYPIRGKTVLIFGLAACNCDALSLWKGAEKVVVVDYNKPVCQHPKVQVYNHDELVQSGIKADFAISFSSFEHDGLGRYGDPLEPDGDLYAMHFAKKCLVPGGILFLSVPLGGDSVVWNAQRVYGRVRLPKLLEGWNCMDVFGYGEEFADRSIFNLPPNDPMVRQPLLVLAAMGKDNHFGCTQGISGERYERNSALLREIQALIQ